MAEESAILDTPVDIGMESDVSTESTPVDNGIESPDSQEPNDQGLIEELDEPAIVGTKLSQKALATLNELKGKDAKLAAQFKQSLFVSEALKTIIPEGIQGVKALKESIESVGGVEGIQQLQNSNKEWEALDRQFSASDPKFVDAMAEFAPDAFAKLAPAIFEKFGSISPDGFASYICSQVIADMQSQQIPLMLARLTDFVGDKPQAVELLNKVIGYVNALNTTARQAVKPVAGKQAAQPDTRISELDQREAKIRGTEFRGAADSALKSIFNSEWARLSAGFKIDARQDTAIRKLFGGELMSRLKSDANFDKNVQKFFKAGDVAGYNKFILAAYKKYVGEALRGAIETINPAKKPGPNGATQPAQRQQQAARSGQGAQPVAQGWVKVQARPKVGEIDFEKSTNTMINQGRAILLDKRQVQWR